MDVAGSVFESLVCLLADVFRQRVIGPPEVGVGAVSHHISPGDVPL
jgi:hypothetical protein